MPDGAARRRHDSDSAWIGRQGSFALRIEEAFRIEVAKEALKFGLKDALADRTQIVDDDLQRATDEVEVGAAVHEHLVALLDGDSAVFAAEECTGQRSVGLGIGEVEVVVPRSGSVEAADFTLDPDIGELRVGLELRPDVAGDFADRSGLWSGRGNRSWLFPIDALLLGASGVEAGWRSFGHLL